MKRHSVMLSAAETLRSQSIWVVGSLAAAFFGLAWPLCQNIVGSAIFSFILTELAVRAILRIAYGSKFRNALFGVVIEDHPVYGYALKKGLRLRALRELVFDAFAFPPGIIRVFRPDENQKLRVDLNVNSLGFRGPEFLVKPVNEVFRIFCTGGSTTACDRTSDSETWPARLEQNLRSLGYAVEVINAGCFGWTAYQELLRFEKEIVGYSPNLILLHQGWNEEFEFSSQGLGRHWRPRTVRNSREANYLYTAPSAWLSQQRFLGAYLPVQHFLKHYVFGQQCSFANPDRWQMLREAAYISAWLECLRAFAQGAAGGKFGVLALNYPALPTLGDSAEERKLYYQNTRLTALHADYQALSKARITHVLSSISPGFPVLDLESDFREVRGFDRLELFVDEMHFSPKGSTAFAEKLAKQLGSSSYFKKLYERKEEPEPATISDRALRQAKTNPGFIERFLQSRIAELKREIPSPLRAAAEVPSDRYTTF